MTAGFRAIAAIVLASTMAVSRADAAEKLLGATPVHPVTHLEMGGANDDLRFLDELVGSARVVSVGETLHGYQQSLELRNRLFEYLVEEHAFTAIAVESGFAESTAIDDYVTGQAVLTRQLVQDVFSFNSSAAWDANRRLIEWMRSYNARATTKRRLHFYGIEMLGHVNYTRDADRIHLRRAADQALDFVTSVAPTVASAQRIRFEPLLSALVATPYGSLSLEQRNALTLATADLVSLFERRHVEWLAQTSSLAYHRAYRAATNARNLDADLRANGWWTPTPRKDGDIAQRDASMAQHVSWALDREGPAGRLMVFSANGHASRDAGRGEPICLERSTQCSHSMGSHLHRELGRDMAIIAMIDRRSALPDPQLTELWKQVDAPLFGVDFSALPVSGPLRAWWDRRSWYENDLHTHLPLVRNFDAAIFTNGLTPATPITTVPDDTARLRTAVDEIVAAQAPVGTAGNPGFAVGVALNGRVLLAQGYGDADLEQGVAIAADSAFYVASVSKSFTAFAIALLAREGRIDLDADLHRHLPAMPDFGYPIKVRHLIEHTSGLRDYGLLEKLTQHSRADWLWQEQAVNLVRRQRSLAFEPGSEAVYSNTGYLLLAEIVRSVTGKTLREFAEQRLFEPLGMTHTVFADDATQIIPRRVQGYSRSGEGWRKALLNAETVGGTGIVTTVGDLLKWLNNYGTPLVGDAALIEQITTPARLQVGGAGYNFGVRMPEGRRRFMLGGEAEAFRATGLYFPDAKLSIVVLANSLAALTSGRIATRVADAYFGEQSAVTVAVAKDPNPAPIGIADAALAEVLGDYRIEEVDTTYTLAMDGGKLVARTLWSVAADAKRQSEWALWSPTAVTLVPIAPDTFQSNSFALGVLGVRRDSRRRVIGLEVIRGSLRGIRLERIVSQRQ